MWSLKDDLDMDDHIIGLIMAHQYSLKKGMELFGERAEKARMKELSQIQDMETYTPMDLSKLSNEEKRKASLTLFLL